MKKIILLTLSICFAVLGAKAQVTLTVTNNTCEDIDYIAHYSTAGTCMMPDATMPSGGVNTIPAGNSTTFTITTGGWNFATVHDHCTGGSMYAVGNSCSWLIPSIGTSASWTTGCAPCAPATTITATWNNSGGGSATLDFN